MKVQTYLLLLSLLLLWVAGAGQVRKEWSINDNWKFRQGGYAYVELEKFDDSKWQSLSLPHTWNAEDPFDDDKTYYRGVSWYRKKLWIDDPISDKNYYIVFEGASQVADVFINGDFAGKHIGGYTAFTVDITRFIKRGENLLAVQLNNAHDPYVPPLSIGYASYGGIYRDVWMVTTDKLHFADVNTNSRGVYITTPLVSETQATVAVKTTIQNDGAGAKSLQYINTVFDHSGKQVATTTQQIRINAGQQIKPVAKINIVNHPHLWSPEDPYLYTVVSQLVADGKQIDEVSNAIGFRWYAFDANTGFSLNGKKLVLHGTNRHQDLQGKGDALTNADHERDLKMIKDMGCNFVRLAHYPQAPEVLQLADRLGLLIWEETPVLNYITESPAFLANSQQMLREMITQGFNHPAVILWGFSNEILLYSKEGARIQTHSDTAYLNALRVMEQQLDSTVRAEDPSRVSTMAMHGSDDYYKYQLDIIPQVASYNIYNGWYSGKLEDFGSDLDRYHQRRPQQVLFISEYGAEGEIKLASEKPVRMDYTTQYQRLFHESYLRQINQRPWLAGTAIWNEFDFSQPNIGGPTPHRNQKGLVTWDRKPKDVYYLYKANWNAAPMVYVATRDWLVRGGEEGAYSTIDVYSNGSEISLSVNGQLQKKQKPDDLKKCSWQVRLAAGENTILATTTINGKACSDLIVVIYKAYPANLSASAFQQLAVNVGSNAQYTEPSGNIWVADRPYTKGSFGYMSGTPQLFSRSEVIKNTADVPLFYTYQDSLQGYQLDVPDGDYKLTLCFAEGKYTNAGQRVFDVLINQETVIKDFDIVAGAGFAQAVKKTFVLKVSNHQGIHISFNVTKGSAVLSGVEVAKQ